MKSSILALKTQRDLALKAIEGLTNEQLMFVPKGFKNNILWNFGHAIVSHQLLCYGRSGLSLRIDAPYVEAFRKATSPVEWDKAFSVDYLKDSSLITVDWFEKDLQDNKFEKYEKYMTSSGLELTDIEIASMYSLLHEGYHLGMINALKKVQGID